MLIVLTAVSTVATAFVTHRTHHAQDEVQFQHTKLAEQAGDAIGNVLVLQSLSWAAQGAKAAAPGDRPGAQGAVSGPQLVGGRSVCSTARLRPDPHLHLCPGRLAQRIKGRPPSAPSSPSWGLPPISSAGLVRWSADSPIACSCRPLHWLCFSTCSTPAPWCRIFPGRDHWTGCLAGGVQGYRFPTNRGARRWKVSVRRGGGPDRGLGWREPGR